MFAAKTFSYLVRKIFKTALCLGLAVALSNQARYIAEQEGILEIDRNPARAISALRSSSPNESIKAPVQYCSEIVAIHDPSNTSGVVQTSLAFDDSWFSADPGTYNHELAVTCSVLAAICNSESHYYSDIHESSAYAEEALASLGFTDIQTDSYRMRSHPLDQMGAFFSGSHDVAAYAFASKKIKTSPGVEETLVFVGVRGSYGAEWLSNIKILNDTTSNSDHKGFKKAEGEIEEALTKYVWDIGADPSTVKLLITGHSRGGSVANLLGADFNNGKTPFEDMISADGIFTYTYASPASTQNESRDHSKYDNIFNIINPSDIVCQLPLASWNYGRYGVTVSLPGTDDADFKILHNEMQIKHIRNTGYGNPCTTEDLSHLATFEESTSQSIPNAEKLFTPFGIFEAIRALCSIDYIKALYVHYPDSYISWMQAVERHDLVFNYYK